MGDGNLDLTAGYLKSFIELNDSIDFTLDDVNAMLVSFLKQVVAFVRCEACSVLIYSGTKRNLLVSYGPSGHAVKYVAVESGSVASWVMEHRQSVVINSPSTDERFFSGKPISSRPRNMIASPVAFGEDCFGIVEAFNRSDSRSFTNDDVSLLETLGIHSGRAYVRHVLYMRKNDLLSSLGRCGADGSFMYLPFKSPMMQDVERTVSEIARTNASVLISGENGSGKGVFARRLHEGSAGRSGPFVSVGCVSKSEELLSREIFGCASGGKLEGGSFSVAEGGTLFLDEVGSLPLGIQDRLYDVLHDGFFIPDGSDSPVGCSVRVMASTSKNLERMVSDGRFREKLYYALNVLPLNIPPLRKHPEDIVPLASFFLERYSRIHKKDLAGFSPSAERVLSEYGWPGNVSELKNAVEHSCICCPSNLILPSDLSFCQGGSDFASEMKSEASRAIPSPDGDRSLKTAVNEFKRNYITRILAEEGWNQSAAARTLDVQRTYVSKLISDLGISRNG